MLRTLGHPVAFLGLAVGFLVAIVTVQLAQAWTARLLGDRTAVKQVGGRHSLDPFGVVAAVVSVPGWGRTAEMRSYSPGRQGFALLMGPLVAALLGLAALLAYRVGGGPGLAAPGPGDVLAVQGEIIGLTSGQTFLLCAALEALGVAVLSFVPLPPLTGWKLLALLSPRSLGWQRAHYWLEERNIGVVALLALLLLPLGVGGDPLLVDLIDTIVGLVVGSVA